MRVQLTVTVTSPEGQSEVKLDVQGDYAHGPNPVIGAINASSDMAKRIVTEASK